MKTTITVEAITEKVSKANAPFVTLKTSLGTMNCWDTTIIKSLRENLRRPILVEIEEKGNYKNIIEYGGPSLGAPVEKIGVDFPVEIYTKDKGHITMIMSYVKDMTCEKIILPTEFDVWCMHLMELYQKMLEKRNEK